MVTKEQLIRLYEKQQEFSNARGELDRAVDEFAKALQTLDEKLVAVVRTGKACAGELVEFPFTNEDKPKAIAECDVWIEAARAFHLRMLPGVEAFAEASVFLVNADTKARGGQ